jgi:hypothetical protein
LQKRSSRTKSVLLRKDLNAKIMSMGTRTPTHLDTTFLKAGTLSLGQT